VLYSLFFVKTANSKVIQSGLVIISFLITFERTKWEVKVKTTIYLLRLLPRSSSRNDGRKGKEGFGSTIIFDKGQIKEDLLKT